MLKPSDYRPHLAAFAEAQRRFHLGEMDEAGFELHARAFRIFLQQLQKRLNWDLPLLEGFSESKVPVQLLVDPLQNLTEMMKDYPAHAGVTVCIHDCQRLLQRLSWFFQQLPVMVEVPIVNELLILASVEGEVNPAPVRQRLPILLNWLADLENGWKTFLLLNPHRQSLAAKALLSVQAMKGAAGCLHLHCEGQDPDGLRNGLKLMVKALEALEPFQETRAWEEMQERVFSPDPCLERGSRLLSQVGVIPPEYQRELKRWTEEKARALSELSSYLWVTNTDSPEAARLAGVLQELLGNVSKVFELDQTSFLQKLEQWRSDFEALSQEFRTPPQTKEKVVSA